MSDPANTPSITDPLRELDRRCNDGIDVRLLWRPGDNRVLVAVDHGKTGERFSIEVPAGGNALDFFHHPYAYAALHGIDSRSSPQTRRPRSRLGWADVCVDGPRVWFSSSRVSSRCSPSRCSV